MRCAYSFVYLAVNWAYLNENEGTLSSASKLAWRQSLNFLRTISFFLLKHSMIRRFLKKKARKQFPIAEEWRKKIPYKVDKKLESLST